MNNFNFDFDNIPDSGNSPLVFFDINYKGKPFGTLHIELFREVFPEAVENFIYLCKGSTYRTESFGFGKYEYQKITRRTYENCKFYDFLHDNYIISGDIYKNDGTDGGTIYNDCPIPAYYHNYYYPHDQKGLISLIPYYDPSTGTYYFDSNFMITLDEPRPNNLIADLDKDQIVIGHVYEGLDVLDRMNHIIRPFAGRGFPDFRIANSDLNTTLMSKRRRRPIVPFKRKKVITDLE